MGLYKHEEKKRIVWRLALIAVLSIAAYGLSSIVISVLDEWSNEFELKPRLSAPVSGLAAASFHWFALAHSVTSVSTDACG